MALISTIPPETAYEMVRSVFVMNRRTILPKITNAEKTSGVNSGSPNFGPMNAQDADRTLNQRTFE
jgi:hypothetical protein